MCRLLSPIPLTLSTGAVPVLGKDQPQLWQPALPKPASTGRGKQDGVDRLCTLRTGSAPQHVGSGDKGASVFLDTITPTSQAEFRLSPGQTCLKPKLEMSLNITRLCLAERDLPEALHKVWAVVFSWCFIIRGCVTHQRNLAKLQLAFGWRTVWRDVAKSFYTVGLTVPCADRPAGTLIWEVEDSSQCLQSSSRADCSP